MATETLVGQLERIASAADFATESESVVQGWLSARVGIDAVEPVLRFIECHPHLHIGMPGALVHFVECFSGKGYERLLLESLERRPTFTTVWMLNRVINDTSAPDERTGLVAAMKRARSHPQADAAAVEWAGRFAEKART